MKNRNQAVQWIVACWGVILGVAVWTQMAHSFDVLGAAAMLFLVGIFVPLLVGRLLAMVSMRAPAFGIFQRGPSMRLVAITMSVCAVLAFVGSISFSKAYWGYWIKRPDILPGVLEAKEIVAFSSYETGKAPKLNKDILPDLVKLTDKYSYDVPWGRAAAALFHGGKLAAETPQIDEGVLSQLRKEIVERRWEFIEDGEGEYRGSAQNLRGTAIVYKDAAGATAVHLSLGGSQISNDHYPYYEVVLPLDGNGHLGAVKSWLRFYYDIAGIEGLEWVFVAPVLALAVWLAVQPFVLIFTAIRNRRRDDDLSAGLVQV